MKDAPGGLVVKMNSVTIIHESSSHMETTIPFKKPIIFNLTYDAERIADIIWEAIKEACDAKI